MKIVFPKEMKIRTATNGAGIFIAGLMVSSAISLLDNVIQAGNLVIYASLLFVAGGIHFWMGKYVWDLKKSKIDIPKIGIAALCMMFLGIDTIGGIVLLTFLPPVTVNIIYPFLVLGGGFLYFLVDKYMWSLKKKKKLLEKLLLICSASLCILGEILVMLNLNLSASRRLRSALISSFVFTIAAIVNTGLSMWSERKLVKINYLVFS
ncbi:hypothetical protein GF325_08905 [Candidatus Bathyarchaeota archaeon]|nr:hypothetical protein [Candidatus Bathyarchaeota archaeon]